MAKDLTDRAPESLTTARVFVEDMLKLRRIQAKRAEDGGVPPAIPTLIHEAVREMSE